VGRARDRAALALSGILMEPLPWRIVAAMLVATTGLALLLDQIKLPVMAAFKVQ